MGHGIPFGAGKNLPMERLIPHVYRVPRGWNLVAYGARTDIVALVLCTGDDDEHGEKFCQRVVSNDLRR